MHLRQFDLHFDSSVSDTQARMITITMFYFVL